MRWFCRYILGPAAALPLLAVPSPATPTEPLNKWQTADRCAAESIAKYPDHDHASLQARDRFVDRCLAEHNLPPRQHLAP